MVTILDPSGQPMTVRASEVRISDTILPVHFKTQAAPSMAPAPSPQIVTVSGSTVTIDGKGFTVRPEEQAAFIQKQTGGVGTSAQQAIQRAEVTSERISLEKQTLAAKTEQVRQEQIFGGTIAGQLQAKPSQVGIVPEGDQQFATLGFGSAFFGAGRKLVQRLTGSPIRDRPSFGDIILPFDRTVTPKAGREVIVTEGLLLDTKHLTGFQKRAAEKAGVSITTFGALQVELETGRQKKISVGFEEEQIGLTAGFGKLQERIDLGLLTVSEAEKVGEELTTEAQTRFETKQEEIFKAHPEIPGIRAPPRSGVRTLVDLALFTNPLTSAAAAAASAQQDPLKIDLGELERGTTIEGAITSRPSGRTTMFFGGTLLGGASLLAAGGRAATAADVEAAFAQAQLGQKGFRIPGKEGFVDISTGVGLSGDAAAIQRSLSVSRLTDTGKLIITEGEVGSLVVGRTFFGQKPFVSGGARRFSVDPKVIPSKVEGLSIGIPQIETVPVLEFKAVLGKKGLVGEALSLEGAIPTTERLLGVGIKKGDFIFSTGGRLSRVSAKEIEGSGFRFIEDITLQAPQEAKSILKILKPTKDTGLTIFKEGGTKTPFSTTFGQQIPQQITKSTFTLPEIKPSPPTTITQEPIGFGLQRAVGGLGLTEAQIQKGQGLAFPQFQEFTQQGLLPPLTKGGFVGLKFDPALSVSIGQESLLGLGQVSSLTQKPIQRVRTTGTIQQGLILQEFLVSPQKLQTAQLQEERLILEQKSLLREVFEPTTPSPRGGFTPFGGFGIPFGFPPLKLLGGAGERGRKIKRKKPRVPIRPSFTGIVLGIEEAPIISEIFGVFPGQIRGLATGFEVPKKKKVKKKKVKKK